MIDAHPHPPVDCPVCGFALTVSRLTCEACGTELTGRFTPCALCALDSDQRALVQHLVAAAGDLDEMSARTGLRPDAVRERLRAIADSLGLSPRLEPRRIAPATSAAGDTRADDGDADFLERLALGVVEADEALRRMP